MLYKPYWRANYAIICRACEDALIIAFSWFQYPHWLQIFNLYELVVTWGFDLLHKEPRDTLLSCPNTFWWRLLKLLLVS